MSEKMSTLKSIIFILVIANCAGQFARGQSKQIESRSRFTLPQQNGLSQHYNETTIFNPKKATNSFLVQLWRGNIGTDEPVLEPTALYATIALGTPAQKINVQFDTGSSETWVPLYQSRSENNYLHYNKGYRANQSSTGTRENNTGWTFYHRGVTIQADAYTDFWSGIGLDARGFKQRFLAARRADVSTMRGAPFDGIVGLAPIDRSATGTMSLVEILRSIGAIQLRLLGLYINSKADSTSGGELTFGGLDQRRYTGQVYSHPVNQANFWAVLMQLVQVTQMSGQVADLSCRSSCQAIFDTGLNDFILGPVNDVITLMNHYLYARYDTHYDLYIIDCSSQARLPSLTFIIDNIRYLLLPSNYVRYLGPPTSNTCYVAIRPTQTGGNWILGTNFLSAYYTVFDYDQRRIGFASLNPMMQ